jgi:Domain of unknown function (DUF6458)
MGIGVSVFLIAVGLILALAVHVTVAGLDVQLVGWILVIAGVLGLVTSFAFFGPRRRRTTMVERTTPVDPGYPQQPGYVQPGYDAQGRPVVRERSYDDGPI